MLTEKDRIELFLKGIAGIVAVVGFILTVTKFLEERRKSNETARIESQRPFYSKQQEIYFDPIETTAFLSNWLDSRFGMKGLNIFGFCIGVPSHSLRTKVWQRR